LYDIIPWDLYVLLVWKKGLIRVISGLWLILFFGSDLPEVVDVMINFQVLG